MRVSTSFTPAFAALLAVAAAAGLARAQSGYSPITSRTSGATVTPTSYERNTGRNNPALNFFGNGRSSGYVATSRSVEPPPPVAVQTKPMGKPFSGYRQSATISPYLGLDTRESDFGLPNYFLFVKPQLDQDHINHKQQTEYRHLRQTVRQASAGGAITSPAGGIPTTGHSSQFMNSGGYYPTMTR